MGLVMLWLMTISGLVLAPVGSRVSLLGAICFLIGDDCSCLRRAGHFQSECGNFGRSLFLEFEINLVGLREQTKEPEIQLFVIIRLSSQWQCNCQELWRGGHLSPVPSQECRTVSLVWALWGGGCDLLPPPEWVAVWHGLGWKANPYLLAKQNSELSFKNPLKPAIN